MNRTSTKLNLDVKKIRDEFPLIDDSQVYLDSAATSQKPQQVIDRLVEYYTGQNANVHRALYKLANKSTQAYENSRTTVAKFINAQHDHEIIFTKGTTDSINLVASGWGRKFLKEGDEILLTEMEHHSNLVPWQILAGQLKLKLRFIPFLNNGCLNFQKLGDLIHHKTKFVSLTHMSNVLGTINQIKGIIRLAHVYGAPVLVDGAQSVPHIPVDVQKLDCDFLAFSGHKMCGPTGIGVLYGKQKLLNLMDPYLGGGDMINSVSLDRSTWNSLPYKFEAGTPNIAGAVGLGAAIEYLNDIGMNNITLYEQELTTYVLERIRKIDGIEVFGSAPERGGIISFKLGNVHPHDIAQFLDQENIAIRAGHHCAQPIMQRYNVPAMSRVSFYFYNTFEEIDKFIVALKKVKEFFL